MARARERSNLLSKTTADFTRQLPLEASQALDEIREYAPAPDWAVALNACTEAELLVGMQMTKPADWAVATGDLKLRVKRNQPQLLKTMLPPKLRTSPERAKPMMCLLSEATYRWLLVKAASVQSEVQDWYNEAADTPALRALAVATAARLPDPSATVALIGMAREHDVALEILFDETGRARLQELAAQLEQQWEPEWQERLQQWTRVRCGLGPIGEGDPAVQAEVASPAEPVEDAWVPRQQRRKAERARRKQELRQQQDQQQDTGVSALPEQPTVADSGAVAQSESQASPAATQLTQSSPLPVSPRALLDVLHDLSERLPAVQAAADAVLQAVGEQGRPTREDLQTLLTYSTAHERLNHRLAPARQDLATQDAAGQDAAGQDAAPGGMLSLSQMADVLHALLTREQGTRERDLLLRLQAAKVPDSLEREWQHVQEMLESALQKQGSPSSQVTSADQGGPADEQVAAQTSLLVDLAELALAGVAARDEDDADECLFERAVDLRSRLGAAGKVAISAQSGKIILPDTVAASVEAGTTARSTPAAAATAASPASGDATSSRGQGSGAAAVEPTPAGGDGGTAKAVPGADALDRPAPTSSKAGAAASLASEAGDKVPGDKVPDAKAADAVGAATNAVPVAVNDVVVEPANGHLDSEVAGDSRDREPHDHAPVLHDQTPAVSQGVAAVTVAPLTPANDPALYQGVDLAYATPLAELLDQGRLGLAHHLLHALGAVPLDEAVRLLALSSHMKARGGPCTDELTALVELLGLDDIADDTGSALLATVMLGRLALRTGNTHAGQLLEQLAAHLDSAWGRLAKLLGTAAITGALTETPESHDEYRAGVLRDLREHLRSASLRQALQAYSSTDPITSAAARLAERALPELRQLANRQAVSGDQNDELTYRRVMDLELLKLDEAKYDPSSDTVAIDRDVLTDPERLVALVPGVHWQPILTRRLQQDDYLSATIIARAFLAEQLPVVQDQQQRRADQLLREVDERRLLLVGAGSSDVDQQQELDAALGRTKLMLTGAHPDVAAAVQSLDAVEQHLQQLRSDTAADLRTRLAELASNADLPELPASERERLLACIERGDYDQVDNELSYLARGEEPPPPADASVIAAFYPQVVDALAELKGITPAMTRALNLLALEDSAESASAADSARPARPDGARATTEADTTADRKALTTAQALAAAGINLPTQSERRRDLAEALQSWIDLPGHVRQFTTTGQMEVRRLLTAPLHALGLTRGAVQITKLDYQWAYGRGYRFLDVTGLKPTSKAWIPAFGSRAGGRYRLVLVTERPTVEELTTLRTHDDSDVPLIILYFGVLSTANRLKLAQQWNDPTLRPAIVIDDAALLYAAVSSEAFSTLMHITMPFTSAAPYSSEKDPRVPEEMFYGRDAKMREIMALNGHSLMYGGRGMGKSALLLAIKRHAETHPEQQTVVVWVELERSQEFDDPGMVWNRLADELGRAGLKSKARGFANLGAQNQVERLVSEYLEENPHGKILMFIDEADAFFSADARRDFRVTSKLFEMRNRHRNCKVVFSGLHGVAHHHDVGNNPFSPSGATTLGPLERRDAFALLTRPLAVLGYQLGLDEAHRILMHCNNMPYLVQMYADRLLRRLLQSRRRADAALPWKVDPKVVDEVYADKGLREGIHNAFKATLDLDDRYSVIVNIVARHTHDHSATAMTEREIFEEARKVWPAGFAPTVTTMSAFRELLNELTALGILAPPADLHSGRTLRSNAVLNSLGSRENIQLALEEAASKALTERDARLQFHPPIGRDKHPGPLSSAQLADLAGHKGNRVRVLVGTPASGLTRAVEAMQDPGHEPVLRDIRVVPSNKSAATYRGWLREGATGLRKMTIVSPLYAKNPSTATCDEALADAQYNEIPADPKASRAVVFIAGPDQLPWLAHLADRPDADELVMPMERFTSRNLRLHWRDGGGKLEPLGKTLAEPLMAATGGWYSLIDQVSHLAKKAGAEAALEQFLEQQQDPSWPQQFLTDLGVLAADGTSREGEYTAAHERENLRGLLAMMVALEEPHTAADLASMASTGGYEIATLTLARWLGLLEQNEQGLLCLAPLVGTTWSRYLQQNAVPA